MDDSAADRNLLFGLLALQNGLIDQVQLVGAFQAWTLDRDRPLADHLVGRGDLDDDDRGAVDALVVRHLKKHGGSAAKSLAALPAGRSTQRSLAALGDPELAASVAGVPVGGSGLDSGGELTFDIGPKPVAWMVAASWPGLPNRSRRSRASSCPKPTRQTEVRPSAMAMGRVPSTPRLDASAYSARSPAAAWAPSTAAATSTWAATWP